MSWPTPQTAPPLEALAAPGAAAHPGEVHYRRGVTEPAGQPPASTPRVAIGVVLLVAGVVLWLVTDVAATGLVSGIGVVLLYTAVAPRIEGWRSGQDTGG